MCVWLYFGIGVYLWKICFKATVKFYFEEFSCYVKMDIDYCGMCMLMSIIYGATRIDVSHACEVILIAFVTYLGLCLLTNLYFCRQKWPTSNPNLLEMASTINSLGCMVAFRCAALQTKLFWIEPALSTISSTHVYVAFASSLKSGLGAKNVEK